jgi:integrase
MARGHAEVTRRNAQGVDCICPPRVLDRAQAPSWPLRRARLPDAGRNGLHESRHTFAALMVAAGVNAKALSTYMGHANIAITFDLYGHLMPGNDDEAVALVDAYLERADTRGRLTQLD